MLTTWILEAIWRRLMSIDNDIPRLRVAAGYFAHGIGLGCGSTFPLPWRPGDRCLCQRVAGHAHMHHNRRHHVGWDTESEVSYLDRRPGPAIRPCGF